MCAVLCAGLALVHVPGCQITPRRSVGPADTLPAYEQVARAWNDRLAGLTRVWSPGVVRVRYPDADGEERVDQGEGHFQFVAPDALALTIGKLGETYLHAGASGERYWWIDRQDEGVAFVGRRDRAAERAAESLGVPVNPSDLADLMGLAAWAPDGGEVRAGPALQTGPTIDVLAPVPGGRRLARLDADTLRPVRVERWDGQGRLLASCDLSDETDVVVRGSGVRPRLASRYLVQTGDERASVRLTLSAPESSPDRPRPIAFDLDALLRAYNIARVVDVDEEREP